MSSRDQLLIVSQFYWPEEIGSGPYVADMAEWFVEQGKDVTVLAARPHYPSYEVPPAFQRADQDESNINGVEVRRLPTRTGLGGGPVARMILEGSLAVHAGFKLVRGDVNRAKQVVAVCPSILMVLAGTFAVRRGGTVIALVHDIQSGLAAGLGMVGNRLLYRLMRLVEAYALNRADVVVVLSPHMRTALRKLGVRSKIEVIPVWVDTSKVYPVSAHPESCPTVLYMGSLGRKQGLDQVLDAAAILQRTRPKIQITIRGGGSEESRLKRKARDLNLMNVTFKGIVPREKLNECLGEAHIHLVPQSAVGVNFAVPSKAYTIMAAGRPIVATAEPGSPLWQLGTNSQAIVCSPPMEPERLATEISALMDSPTHRDVMGQNGRDYVERHVARNVVLSQLERLFDRAGYCSPKRD